MLLTPLLDGSWHADGVDGNLLRVIARRLNFSVIIKVPADGTAKGELPTITRCIVGEKKLNYIISTTLQDPYFPMAR